MSARNGGAADDAARARKRARKLWWSVAIGRPLFSALASTWRIEEENTEVWRRLKAEGKPYVLAVWHGQMLPVIWTNSHRDLAALASSHGDAEIAARMMQRWGYHLVRGSSSQGGREALAQAVDLLRQGRAFAFTPDGPRGPRGEPKPGVLVASMRSGVPIIGIRTAVSRAWRLRSWDRTAIPKPFARVRLVYSEPWVAPDASEASIAKVQELLGPAEAGTLERGQ